MKRLSPLILTFLVICSPVQLRAQTLYNAVIDRAKTAAASQASESEKITGRYKVNALNYIVAQCKAENKPADNRLLDTQAVSLESFISDYLSYTAEAAQISDAKRQEILRCYTSASFSHPLFPNASPLAPGGGGGELLPFSLNTDWVAAYDQATTIAKQILRKK